MPLPPPVIHAIWPWRDVDMGGLLMGVLTVFCPWVAWATLSLYLSSLCRLACCSGDKASKAARSKPAGHRARHAQACKGMGFAYDDCSKWMDRT
jgi:hypothetical protein